ESPPRTVRRTQRPCAESLSVQRCRIPGSRRGSAVHSGTKLEWSSEIDTTYSSLLSPCRYPAPMGKLRPRSYSAYAFSELNWAATELFHSSPSKAPWPSVIARALETPDEEDGRRPARRLSSAWAGRAALVTESATAR